MVSISVSPSDLQQFLGGLGVCDEDVDHRLEVHLRGVLLDASEELVQLHVAPDDISQLYKSWEYYKYTALTANVNVCNFVKTREYLSRIRRLFLPTKRRTTVSLTYLLGVTRYMYEFSTHMRRISGLGSSRTVNSGSSSSGR